MEKLIVRTATVAWCAQAYFCAFLLVEHWCRFFYVTGAQVFHVVTFVAISLLVWQWPTDDVAMRRRASRVIHGCVIGLSVLVIFCAFRYAASFAFVQWFLSVVRG